MKFTICGSARFESLWHEWNKQLGLIGHISYSLMTFPSVEGSKTWYTDDEKEILDLAHLAKIEESDAILVLNKDGYIGDSTKREIKWARLRNKSVFWLEDPRSQQQPVFIQYNVNEGIPVIKRDSLKPNEYLVSDLSSRL